MPKRLDNFTLWAALAYPTVDAETLMDWCRFNALFTNVENQVEQTLDTDRADSAIGIWDLIVRALYRMQATDDPAQLAREASPRPEVQQCLLMVCRLAERMSRRKAGHFFHCVARMAHAQRDEYTVLTTAQMDIHDCIDYRMINHGIPLFVAAAHGMCEQEMSAAEWNDPSRVHLDQLVAKHCCLVNDLYSFEKEHRERGQRRHLIQAVTVLMESDELDVQGAVDRLVGIIDGFEEEYLQVRDRILARPGATAGLREYCRRLEDIIAGNLHYMLISPRYFGAGFTGVFAGGTRTITVSADAVAMAA